MNFFKKLFSWGKKSTHEKDKIEKESDSEAENEDVILASQLYKTIKSRLHLNEKQKPQFDFIKDTGSHTGGDFIFLKRKK